MAIELVTGTAGEAHVSAQDVGDFNAYTLGSDSYVLTGCEVSIDSATQVTVGAGQLLVNGRHVILSGSGISLNIANGQTGYSRSDIIAAHYTKSSLGIESVELVVIEGTPATSSPADPSMPTSGLILAYASEAYVELFRVNVVDLAIDSVDQLVTDFETFAAWKEDLETQLSTLESSFNSQLSSLSSTVSSLSSTVSSLSSTVTSRYNFSAGDSISFDSFVCNGYLSSSGTSMVLAVPLNRRWNSVSSATATAIQMRVRSAGVYILGDSSGGNTTVAASRITCSIKANYGLNLTVTLTSSTDRTTANNHAVSAVLDSGSITFA